MSCENRSSKPNLLPAKRTTQKKEFIQIKISTDKNDPAHELYLGYNDEYDDLIQFIPDLKDVADNSLTINSADPIFLKDLSINQTSYILYPNEHVKLIAKNNAFLAITSDKKDMTRDNELSFFNALAAGQKNSESNLFLKKLINIPQHLSIPGRVELLIRVLMVKKLKNAELASKFNSAKYHERSQFLNHYKKDHTISTGFEDIIRAYFFYDFVGFKIDIGLNAIKDNRKDKDKWIAMADSCKATLSSDSLLFIPTYKEAINSYLNYYFKNKNVTDLTKKYDEITHLFKGKTKDFALLCLLKSALNTPDQDYKPVVSRFLNDIKSRTCANYIKTNLQNKNLLPAKSEMLLQKADGSTINVGQLLAANKDRLVLFDFWASWCVPCRQEIPFSKKLSKLYANKPLTIVYVSTDNVKTSWLAANTLLKLSPSFLMVGNINAKLFKELKINTIPRYVLFDKNGDIISRDAPRPSDNRLQQLIDKHIGDRVAQIENKSKLN
jgi:thiol-disulfide isomerase/thioredoxin